MVEPIKTAVWPQTEVRVCGIGLWLRLNAGAVCDAQRRFGGTIIIIIIIICGLRRYISESYLFLPFRDYWTRLKTRLFNCSFFLVSLVPTQCLFVLFKLLTFVQQFVMIYARALSRIVDPEAGRISRGLAMRGVTWRPQLPNTGWQASSEIPMNDADRACADAYDTTVRRGGASRRVVQRNARTAHWKFLAADDY